MSRTADFALTEPAQLEAVINALKKQIKELQEQRKNEGLFLDIKNETANLAKLRAEIAAALQAGQEEAAALRKASEEENAAARLLIKSEAVKAKKTTDAEWAKLEKAQDSLKLEWEKLFAAQDIQDKLKKDLEVSEKQFAETAKKAQEAIAALKANLAEVSFV